MSNGNDKWVFMYVPDMFQKLKGNVAKCLFKLM